MLRKQSRECDTTRYVRYKHEQIAWSFQLIFFLLYIMQKGGVEKIYIGLKWHRSAGPAEVKFAPVRQESYQKLSAGPACISDPACYPYLLFLIIVSTYYSYSIFLLIVPFHYSCLLFLLIIPPRLNP